MVGRTLCCMEQEWSRPGCYVCKDFNSLLLLPQAERGNILAAPLCTNSLSTLFHFCSLLSFLGNEELFRVYKKMHLFFGVFVCLFVLTKHTVVKLWFLHSDRCTTTCIEVNFWIFQSRKNTSLSCWEQSCILLITVTSHSDHFQGE